MRTLVSSLGGMSPASRWLLKGGLLVSNTLILCAVLLLLSAGPMSGVTYELHALARYMREICSAVLFLTAFGSAFVEDLSKKRG